ncbi:DNA recombination protein RmuC [bacterium]|nr:DNA recombination protein RmuC [bacterium]HPF34692.1 DNA recombination protein RmuC [Candidatus Krumholzibacteria bacterium]HRX51763.1 DNA recombination protein RmuC [Candidatus Krumholzibacteria bacterium]
MSIAYVLGLIAAALLGFVLGALALRLIAEREKGEARRETARLEAQLEAEREASRRRAEEAARTETELRDAFKALAADALRENNESFLNLARARLEEQRTEARADLDQRRQAVQSLVEPIGKSLEQLREHVAGVEKERKEAAGGLQQLLASLREDQLALQKQTHNLVNALRKPSVRGQWGEMTLKRIVELAGLSQHCDFDLQAHTQGDDQAYRPDMVVRLPGGKSLVVDAKTPLDEYLYALDAQDEEKAAHHLKLHARHVRDHVNVLGQKAYWDQFPDTPDFVVMFLRNEAFLYSALEHDAELLEYAAGKKVILATPTTLIAILKSVAYGWRQEALAENARRISEHGAEMHKRIAAFLGHMTKMGKGLEAARRSYNSAVGSLQRSVLPGARRFEELHVQIKSELTEPPTLDEEVRALEAPDAPAADAAEGS